MLTMLLVACGREDVGLEGRTIPTPAGLDGRAFRENVAKGGNYRLSPTGYDATESFELRAQVHPPRATRADLKMLPRDRDAIAFQPTYVVRGTLVDDGAFRLKPEKVRVTAPATADPLEYGELSNAFLSELRRRGTLPLPSLTDLRQVLRPKQILLRDERGTDRDVSEALDLEEGALVPTLRWGDGLAKRRGNERVVVAYETLALDEGRRASPVRSWLDGKKPGASALTHPGQNPHLKETVDRALDLYRAKFSTEPISMLDFVERFRLADCKMTALAAVQKSSTAAGRAGYRAFVASGNRVERAERIDLVTANHAWNGALDGRSGETLVFADFTPETRRHVEYVYDGSTLKWVLARLEAAKERKEFAAAVDDRTKDGVLAVRAEELPRRLRDDAKAIDAELARLTVARAEALLPNTEWTWETKPEVSFLPETRVELVRKHKTNGERVSITVDPILHWGRRGEAIYQRCDAGGVWDLRSDGAPTTGAYALNWRGTTTLGAFAAEVTNVEKSASSHSKDYYWRMEILFHATR